MKHFVLSLILILYKSSSVICLKEIKKMVSEKRKARKRWKQTRSPGDKRLVNKLSGQLKRAIREIKNKKI